MSKVLFDSTACPDPKQVTAKTFYKKNQIKKKIQIVKKNNTNCFQIKKS